MKLHPVLVGIINAVVPGFGYVLIGERKLFGGLLLAGSICCILLAFIEPAFMSKNFLISTTTIGKILESLWYLFFLIAYGYDAYSIAKAQRAVVTIPVVPVLPDAPHS